MIGCGESTSGEVVNANAPLFTEIPPNFNTQGVTIPKGFSLDILFQERTDSVITKSGIKYPAKGNQDYVTYLPINGSSEHGYVYVSHEVDRIANTALGDGGGGSFFEVIRKEGRWEVKGNFKHIDFSTVGGTLRNCGGTQTTHNTLLSAEETEPKSNASIYRDGDGIQDTSDINGLKRYQNYGWMVEVDPFSGKALRKLYQMGRFEHEDAHCMDDGKTVYLTDDHNPAVFFKFVATKAKDYTKGQLYAFKQSKDGESGEWISLPMEMDSLIHARDMAMKRGASLFMRHEWIDIANGKLYITETGRDKFDWEPYITMGASPAKHFGPLHQGNNQYKDVYGRILEFDPKTNKMRVYLEGGTASSDPNKNMSGPDGLATAEINGKPYLIINEDIIGLSDNRVSTMAFERKEVYNEVYFLDLSIENPTVDDLQRFLAAPRNAETTGSYFTPDGKTYFLSIQHPSPQNTEPFNRSTVIAITGF